MPEEFDPLKMFKNIFGKPDKAQQKESSDKTRSYLETLEHLDYPERIKQAQKLGRERAEGKEHANAILEELSKASFYERHLAIFAADACKNNELIFRMTQDESALLRNMAMIFAAKNCNDEHLLTILMNLKLRERRKLLKRLNKSKRIELIDSFLLKLEEENSRDLARLAYFGSESFVSARMQSLVERMTEQDASRFSYQHPRLCLSVLTELASKAEADDLDLLALVRGALKNLVEFEKAKVLNLFESLLRLYVSTKLPYSHLLKQFPRETVKLLAMQQDYGNCNISSAFAKLSDEQVLECVKIKRFESEATNKFKKLSPELRVKLFEKCADGWRDADGCINASVIEFLPQAHRMKAAKEILALPNLQSKLPQKMNYVRFLDWESVLEETKQLINSPEPESRALAYTAMVSSLRYNREYLSDTLERLHQKKNEADPVRLAFTAALSSLPPSMFVEPTLSLVDAIISDALAAPDLSNSSLFYLGKLLSRIFPFHKKWAFAHICKLLKDRHPRLITDNALFLQEEDLQTFSADISALMQHWQAKESESYINTFASWLEKRLKGTVVSEGLCKLARNARYAENSSTALSILRRLDRRRFAALVPELLSSDQSWSHNFEVSNFLNRKKQSLLTPYLGQNAFKGRFGTGKTRYIPYFDSGFYRWTRKQLAIYSEQLVGLAEAETSSHVERTTAVLRLTKMPDPNFQFFSKVCSLENKDEALRSTTILWLAKADTADSLPLLVSMLNDERARYAIYAMRDALLKMDSARALEILKSVPQGKVTVFKEIVRLAADTKADDAFEWLMTLEQGELHKDVRAAILRALWNYPSKPQTWQVLRKSLESGNSAFAEIALRFPMLELSKPEKRELMKIYNQALKNDSASTRIKALQMVTANLSSDKEQLLKDALTKCLSSETEAEVDQASWALFCVYAGKQPEVLAQSTSAILDKPRNLRIFTDKVLLSFSWMRDSRMEDVRNISSVLAQNPKLSQFRLKLSITILPPEETVQLISNLEEARLLHYGCMKAAIDTLESCRSRASTDIEQLEFALRTSANENIRRIGLAALTGAALGAGGWTERRQEILEEYRKDQSILVSSAADYTFPSLEKKQK